MRGYQLDSLELKTHTLSFAFKTGAFGLSYRIQDCWQSRQIKPDSGDRMVSGVIMSIVILIYSEPQSAADHRMISRNCVTLRKDSSLQSRSQRMNVKLFVWIVILTAVTGGSLATCAAEVKPRFERQILASHQDLEWNRHPSMARLDDGRLMVVRYSS